MKNEDNIMVIQRALMAEINRLNDNEYMSDKENSKQEADRANELCNACNTFMKSVALKMSIMKMVNGSEVQSKQLSKAVGVISEK